MSLYRKHRPQKFIDLVGQDHIKTTLSNALMSGKFSHAYIFAGPKGSGKTTTARILAKALNCTGRDLAKEFEPCDNCISCKEVIGGQSMDVVEIDAASNRGIDEIRDLREKIKFAPTAGRYKVYVIDECHMLTKEAFNALLKTLEEPPSHAIFVLATTELHKVPSTILSRAQLFDFKKAKTEEVVGLLNEIVKREKIKIDSGAIDLIARLAYGAYRDALTLLDQVASIKNTDQSISLNEVQLILGQATEQSVWDFVEALLTKNRNEALRIINEVASEGKDLANFVSEIIELLRKVVLAQVDLEDRLEATKEEKAKIEAFAQAISEQDLIGLIQKMVTVLPQMKNSVLGQLPLEMLVVESTTKNQNANLKNQNDGEKLKEKIDDKPEQKVEPVVDIDIQKSKKDVEPVISKPIASVISEPTASVISKPKAEKSGGNIVAEDIKKPEIEASDSESLSDDESLIANNSGSLASSWSEVVKILRKHNHAIAAMMKDAHIKNQTKDNLVLGVKFKFQADQICNTKIRPVIESAILEATGKTLTIECVVDKEIKIEKPVEREEVLLADAKEIFESE